MLDECLEHLALRPNGAYLDATTGLGGHSGAIARQLEEGGLLLSCDRDAESLELARANLADSLSAAQLARVHFHHSRFSELGSVLASEGGGESLRVSLRLDGLLADLGVSRFQLTEGERGFSLMADGPLDMRMSRTSGEAGGPTAADLVNFEPERKLADLIFKLGEERRSRRIARAIVGARPIHTTGQLAKLIERAVFRTGKLHPATKTFMALRMAVNQELEQLEALLGSMPDWMAPGGRVVILTFHSLEDRMVKRAFQALKQAGRAQVLTKHVLRPSEEETQRNPASRSAKLRALEMV